MANNTPSDKAFHNPEEFLELCKKEGIELTDEELSSISGGISWGKEKSDDSGLGVTCPYCNSKNVVVMIWREDCDSCIYTCNSCQSHWMDKHVD